MSSSQHSQPDSLEGIYAEMRSRLRSGDGEIAVAAIPVTSTIRVIQLRTPTLPPATSTGCYAVGVTAGAGRYWLVDPGSPYPEVQSELDAWIDQEAADGRSLVGVLLTHHHGDHVGGAAHLMDRFAVPIAAHPRTAELLAGRVAVARPIEDEERVPELDADVIAIATPGHAPGHHCFLVRGEGSLIAGDMVAGVGTILVDPDGGDMAHYLASLVRMQTLGSKLLLPAHGPPITDPAAKLGEYLAHRLMREHKVIEALDKRPGATPEQLVPEAYADTASILWPLAARSLRSHLAKLEVDGVATSRDGVWRLSTSR